MATPRPIALCRQVWRASDSALLLRPPDSSTALMLRAHNEQGLQALHEVAGQASAAAGAGTAAAPRAQDAQQPAAALQQQARGPGWGGSHFDSKTDKGSADLYFHYYGCLQHQQNMLQDYIRTGEGGGGG